MLHSVECLLQAHALYYITGRDKSIDVSVHFSIAISPYRGGGSRQHRSRTISLHVEIETHSQTDTQPDAQHNALQSARRKHHNNLTRQNLYQPEQRSAARRAPSPPLCALLREACVYFPVRSRAQTLSRARARACGFMHTLRSLPTAVFIHSCRPCASDRT